MTIFQEDWWLEAASLGTWERIEVRHAGSRASLSFIRKQAPGIAYIAMPPYTRTLGPTFSLQVSKPVTRTERVCALVRELVSKLPTRNAAAQKLPPGSEDIALAFALNGWQCRTEFTFRIDAADSPSLSWGRMAQKTRNVIRSAESRFRVERGTDIDQLIALSRRQIEARRVFNQHRYPNMRQSFSAALERGQATTLSASKDGREAAMVALLWDHDALYLWNTARDPALAGTGALSLLVWEACKLAHGRQLAFDFDGFGTPEAGRFLLSFGGRPVPRPIVSRASPWLSTLLFVRDSGSTLTGGAALTWARRMST